MLTLNNVQYFKTNPTRPLKNVKNDRRTKVLFLLQGFC